MPLHGEAAVAASLMGMSSPSSVRPCHVRTPLVRSRLLTTVHEELDITGLDLIIPGVVPPPLRGGAQVLRCPVELALPSHPGQLRSQAQARAGERPESCLEAFREWIGPATCLVSLCSERLRRSSIPLSHTVAAIAPKLLESPQCCSWPPNLDAECQCHAKHHDALYLHRCSESRVFQIRAKKGIFLVSKAVHRIESVNGSRRGSRRRRAGSGSRPVEEG